MCEESWIVKFVEGIDRDVTGVVEEATIREQCAVVLFVSVRAHENNPSVKLDCGDVNCSVDSIILDNSSSCDERDSSSLRLDTAESFFLREPNWRTILSKLGLRMRSQGAEVDLGWKDWWYRNET